jgi:uncharacterized protein (DUF1330 family)
VTCTAGGKLLIRTADAVEARESGLKQLVVLVEFEDFKPRRLLTTAPADQAALKALGAAADRDSRMVEGFA